MLAAFKSTLAPHPDLKRQYYYVYGHKSRRLPLNLVDQSQQPAGIDNELVEESQHVAEAGALAGLLLPAVEHELVQGYRAAHGCWQTIALFHRQDDLR